MIFLLCQRNFQIWEACKLCPFNCIQIISSHSFYSLHLVPYFIHFNVYHNYVCNLLERLLDTFNEKLCMMCIAVIEATKAAAYKSIQPECSYNQPQSSNLQFHLKITEMFQHSAVSKCFALI